MQWTLNKKLIFIMVALSATMISMILAFNLYSERVLYMTLASKMGRLMDSTRIAIEEMTSKDKSQRISLLRDLKRLNSEGIREINIIDASTKITASTNPGKVGQTTTKDITELIFKSELGEFVSKEGRNYNIIIPVVVKGEHQGYIHFVISTDDIARILKANILSRIMAALLILVLGTLGAIWLASRYTRPIKEVVQAARSVAAGDLETELSITEKDEIRELKESFNQMIRRLSDLRKLEERVRETEHLSTIGELSRTIAHEIRNPLNFISLSVDHLMDRSDQSSRELLQRIKQEIRRLDTLVGNYLSYGKPLKITKRPVDLRVLIEDTLSLVRARAERAGIAITKDYQLDPSFKAPVDQELIKTCLFNILLNAFQAMPDGGTIRITTRKNSDGEVIISIRDSGTGVQKEDLDRIFEPFFTTKQKGLGLGLAMTKRVVEEHGGKVTFESTEGAGSTVTFTMPL
ncbi:sporulation kinase E [bacterium BMS3Bbin06]|nr:sporulation kinase E [bacterium BMS3Abin08]GBE35673.1 sporulation kinase E [bacterium BMS3Bbin06]HDO36925.1 HAMP domain-containing protein [Nitrospirota bacterium]HDY70881.1 HAMP domain-containing protein [Nitrospirota bacterium]